MLKYPKSLRWLCEQWQMGKKENQKKVSKAHEISLAKGQRFVLAALNEKTGYAVLQESKKKEHIFIITTLQKKIPRFE